MRLTNSGRKVWGDDRHHRGLHSRVVVLITHLLDRLRAKIRGHHHDGVAKIDGAPVTIGEASVLEHLQEHVEDVRMRLLDFVEQDHRVRTAAHQLGQVTPFLVADVARRRADQPRDRVLLHELRHVDAHHRLIGIEQELGQRLGELGLAHPGRAEKQERPIRTAWIG